MFMATITAGSQKKKTCEKTKIEIEQLGIRVCKDTKKDLKILAVTYSLAINTRHQVGI